MKTTFLAALMILTASFGRAEAVVSLPASCDTLFNYVINHVENPLKYTIKGDVVSFTEPVHVLPEALRTVAKLPVGTKAGHTTAYTFTGSGGTCTVRINFSSPIERIEQNAAKAEQANVTLLKMKFR